jgi:serpin B
MGEINKNQYFIILSIITIILIIIFAAIGLNKIILNDDKLESLSFSNKTLIETGATEKGIDNIISSYSKFAFNLYKMISNETDGNVFVSPFSVYIALSMTYEGAQDNTAKEMETVLQFSDDEQNRRGSCASIQNDINNRKTQCKLKLSNNVWIQDKLEIKDDFSNSIKDYYFGGIENVDFSTNPERAREIINHWVEKETDDLIKDLLPQDSIHSVTELALTNAIYFSGDWKYSFKETNTDDCEFYLESNQTNIVPMMNLRTSAYKNCEFNVYLNKSISVLELPYIGDEISMFIFLPRYVKNDDIYIKQMSIYDLEDKIDSEYYYECVEKSITFTDNFYISIPKFSFEFENNLKNNLKKMGMNDAFNPSANFKGITDDSTLWIENIFHKASITINEKGTVATAATSNTIIAGYPPEFIADHPFFFTIQDKKTGLILFMGRIMNPLE